MPGLVFILPVTFAMTDILRGNDILFLHLIKKIIAENSTKMTV